MSASLMPLQMMPSQLAFPPLHPLASNGNMTSGKKSNTAANLDPATLKRIDDQAKQFEAVFISQMLKPMFEGLKTDGLFGGGKGEEIFRGVMLQEYGKSIAENNSIGLADCVKAELIKAQAGKMSNQGQKS